MTTLIEELTNGPLAAELAPHITAGADGVVAAILNRADIPAKGKVASHDIRQYLMLVDLLIAIEASPQPACVAAKRALEVFPIFDLSNPMILDKFIEVLDGLVMETLIPDFTETNKAVILSLADTLISRAEQAGLGNVSASDVARAARNDDGSSAL
jgi:hypothetical protein